MAAPIRIPRPEGGEERDVCFYRSHNCRSAKDFRAALENPDVDLLQFNIGAFGVGMPLDVPFVVRATEPCQVCGADIAAWFVWSGARVIAPKSRLWTPS